MKLIETLPDAITQNPAYQNILTRTSVRKYLPAKIDDAHLTAILHAAMSAPSGVNKQPWHFVVVDRHDLLANLAYSLPYAKMTVQAPAAIVVCGEKSLFLEGVDGNLWEQDLSASTENILLSAHALGLGAVWTCLYPHSDRMKAVSDILALGPDLVPFNLVPIGYPATEHAPMDKWRPEKVSFNTGE